MENDVLVGRGGFLGGFWLLFLFLEIFWAIFFLCPFFVCVFSPDFLCVLIHMKEPFHHHQARRYRQLPNCRSVSIPFSYLRRYFCCVPKKTMWSTALLVLCGLVLAPVVLSQENLRRGETIMVSESASAAESSAVAELSTDASASAKNTVMMVSFFSDSTCKMATSMPFIWIANGKCVPNLAVGNSYTLTASASGAVVGTYFSDMSCMMNVFTETYSAATKCVPSPIDSGSPSQPHYMTVKAMNIPVGSLPSGDQLGTYAIVFTTDAACKAFSATSANPTANVVAAQPYSYISQSAGSPFGVTFNAAQALSCSTDGLSAVLTSWNTKVGKNGALTVSSTTPANTMNLPMVPCSPLGYGPPAYSYRWVCI